MYFRCTDLRGCQGPEQAGAFAQSPPPPPTKPPPKSICQPNPQSLAQKVLLLVSHLTPREIVFLCHPSVALLLQFGMDFVFCSLLVFQLFVVILAHPLSKQ